MQDVQMIVKEYDSPELRSEVRKAIRYRLGLAGIDEASGRWIEDHEMIGWTDEKGNNGGQGSEVLAR